MVLLRQVDHFQFLWGEGHLVCLSPLEDVPDVLRELLAVSIEGVGGPVQIDIVRVAKA